jgi:phosphatidylserine/phosphatidylglycerophosphate/cardiolipin synthase-like enzyme
VQSMGDAERDIFWLGTALSSLLTLSSTRDVVKGQNSILEILGEIVDTFVRNGISGNLLTEAQHWATYFRDSYGENETLREADGARFEASCENWIRNLSDLMKERFAHPKELYERLPKIDHIHDAIIQIQTAEHEFVCTSPDNRGIKDKVTEAIDNAVQTDEISLTGYFDNALVDKLTRALRRGVEVRLIVPHYHANERDNISATRRVKAANGHVRQHESNHARLMIFGTKSALVSSADPKTDGLDQNYEAGIWTTNRTLVQSAKDFFDVIWRESLEWNM